jgi:hypothetical protein
MTVALLWILVTISDGRSEGITNVIGKFVTQAQCEKVRSEILKLDNSNNGYGSDRVHHKSRCIEAEIVVVK